MVSSSGRERAFWGICERSLSIDVRKEEKRRKAEKDCRDRLLLRRDHGAAGRNAATLLAVVGHYAGRIGNLDGETVLRLDRFEPY